MKREELEEDKTEFSLSKLYTKWLRAKIYIHLSN